MYLRCTEWVNAGYIVHFLAMYLQCTGSVHHPLPPVTPYDMDTISRIWNNPQERDASRLIEIVSDLEERSSLAMSSTVLDSPPSTIPELENVDPVPVPHCIGGLCLEVSLVHGQHTFRSAGPLPSSPYAYVSPASNASGIGSRERHCRADSEELAASEDSGFVTD